MTAIPGSVHVIGSKRSGGAERFFARLCDALHRHGAPVLAITPPGSDVIAQLDPNTPRGASPMRNVYDPLSRWQLRRRLRRERPEIVQTWMGRATRLVHLPLGAAPVHVARLGGYYRVDHYRHAHAWIGNTRGICDYLVREGLPAGRVHQIGNFVDAPRPVEHAEASALRRDNGIPEDAICILGVGRLHENKDFTTLLRAFSRMNTSHQGRPLWLVLVGDGPERPSLESLAGELDIRRRTVMAGWQTDLAPWYALGTVFVCPSRHEPLGNVILEAWAHGVPVVATRTDGPQELVAGEDNGLLVPVADAHALAGTLDDLLKRGPSAWEHLARRGMETVARDHNADVVVARYLDLYRRLLSV